MPGRGTWAKFVTSLKTGCVNTTKNGDMTRWLISPRGSIWPSMKGWKALGYDVTKIGRFVDSYWVP